MSSLPLLRPLEIDVLNWECVGRALIMVCGKLRHDDR